MSFTVQLDHIHESSLQENLMPEINIPDGHVAVYMVPEWKHQAGTSDTTNTDQDDIMQDSRDPDELVNINEWFTKETWQK